MSAIGTKRTYDDGGWRCPLLGVERTKKVRAVSQLQSVPGARLRRN